MHRGNARNIRYEKSGARTHEIPPRGCQPDKTHVGSIDLHALRREQVRKEALAAPGIQNLGTPLQTCGGDQAAHKRPIQKVLMAEVVVLQVRAIIKISQREANSEECWFVRSTWSRREESNAPSADYESAALPLSYTGNEAIQAYRICSGARRARCKARRTTSVMSSHSVTSDSISFTPCWFARHTEAAPRQGCLATWWRGWTIHLPPGNQHHSRLTCTLQPLSATGISKLSAGRHHGDGRPLVNVPDRGKLARTQPQAMKAHMLQIRPWRAEHACSIAKSIYANVKSSRCGEVALQPAPSSQFDIVSHGRET
jgi:hypothetical protein